MVLSLCNLKSLILFLNGRNLTVLDPDPYSQYGSESRGAISIRITMDPDPDPQHCWLDKFSNLTSSLDSLIVFARPPTPSPTGSSLKQKYIHCCQFALSGIGAHMQKSYFCITPFEDSSHSKKKYIKTIKKIYPCNFKNESYHKGEGAVL